MTNIISTPNVSWCGTSIAVLIQTDSQVELGQGEIQADRRSQRRIKAASLG